MADELDAAIVASLTGGTIFAYLEIGDRFSFNRDGAPPVYTKLSDVLYGFVSIGKRWRSAPRSTVYRVPDEKRTEVVA